MARILVVDDNITTTQTLAALLQRWGYQTTTAFSGTEALSKLEKDYEPVDLIISDLLMPGMGGIEMLKNVRKRWPDIAVIITTTLDSIEMSMEADRLGAFAFLAKPYDTETLKSKIASAIKTCQRDAGSTVDKC